MGDNMIYEAITAYDRYYMFQKYSKQYVINILDVLLLTFVNLWQYSRKRNKIYLYTVEIHSLFTRSFEST